MPGILQYQTTVWNAKAMKGHKPRERRVSSTKDLLKNDGPQDFIEFLFICQRECDRMISSRISAEMALTKSETVKCIND